MTLGVARYRAILALWGAQVMILQPISKTGSVHL